MTAAKAHLYSGHGFSFRGEKNRFVLPPAFRKAVAESSGDRILCLAKHERWNCLAGFGLSRREEFAAQIDKEEDAAIRLGNEYDRDLRGLQLYGFAEIPFDASGRFVMPDYLADLGQLEHGVYFQGGGGFFTIWNPEQLYCQGAGWEGSQATCRKLAEEAKVKAKKK